MPHAAVLIVVLDHARAALALAVHQQPLVVAARRVVRVTQPVGDGQQRAILEPHAAVRPHVALVAVGEAALDAGHRDADGLQARDEVHEVHVVAADVDERVRLVAGEPVLKIRVAVVVGLDHARFADAKLAEVAEGVLPPRHQRPAVEALVVLDADEESAIEGQLLDFHVLRVVEHQRLDAQHVLVVAQGRHDHVVVERVGHRDDDSLPGPGRGEPLFEKGGEHAVGRGVRGRVGLEVLSRERRLQLGVLLERLQRGAVQGTHGDAAHRADALQVIDGREDQVVGDHPAADDQDIQGSGFRVHDISLSR